MNDEQIQVWKREFLRSCPPPERMLLMSLEDVLFQGFIMAKRNMPAIELPTEHTLYHELCSEPCYTKVDILAALKTAGIKYTGDGEK